MKTKISEGGRLVIPAAYRKALKLNPGDDVIITLDDGEIRVMSTSHAISMAQKMVRRYVTRERKLSEELIKERREEASHE